MTALVADVRYALRRLLARRTFTTIVVLSLALGIGANAVIFSLATALLWGAAPYPDPDRVVVAWFTPPDNRGERILATHGNCAALRERSRSFDHVGCVLPDRSATLADVEDGAPGAAGAAHVAGQEFTAGVGEALGVALVIGRWFTREEEQRAEPVAVISDRLWRRQFGGASDIIGRRVRVTNQGLTSEVVTIVGVAPDGFQFFDERTDYWLPFAVPRGAHASPARRLLVVGRLKSGVALHQVQWELNGIARALAAETPFTNKGWGIRVEPVRATLQQGVGRPVLILQGVVLIVLLIACGNVAGLLLAEGVARCGEMAVRSALGASRWRIVWQWLTESVVVSMLGAVLGLAFAWAGLRVLVALLPAGVPGLHAVSLNLSVLAFTAAVSMLMGLILGISPALQASRQDVSNAWKGFGRPGMAVGSGHRLRSAFVVGQISLAVALSLGAGVMIQSLLRLGAVDIGVDTRDLVTFQVQLDGRDYLRDTGGSTPSGAAETELRPRLFIAAGQIRERLAGIAGVQGATAMSATAPLSGFARRYGFVAAGSKATGPDRQPPVTDWFAVLPDYFRTLGAPMLQGRDFTASDTVAALPVIVIGKTMADELWPGDNPIGREIQLRLFNDPPRQVVGVVADVRQSARLQGPERQAYVPFAQVRPIQSGVVAHGLELLTFVVRFPGDAAPLAEAFRDVVAGVDPSRPVTRIQPLQRYVDDQLRGFRQYVILLGLFGTVAVVLAVVGTYGLMAHAVSLRFHEIGIRMALGSSRGRALWLILRRGVTLSAAGLVLGLAGGVVFTTTLESYLWEVTPTDLVTFSTIPSALAAVSLAACYLAARRALTIDPSVVIRQE
ncbi:MAG TPA: ABC transporter permease [Vicinamibacterales bacterium]|nr:ABC transporter permease [Vicinamibacterales bacterium]